MTIKLPSHIAKLFPLLFMLIGNAIAHSIFMIGFPLIGRVLGYSALQTGILLSVSAFCMMLVAPFWGRYIDNTGRAPSILIGILFTSVFLVGCGVAFTYSEWFPLFGILSLYVVVFILRMGQSIGVAGLMPAAQAYIADNTNNEQRFSGMGIMGFVFGFGSILGGYIVMNTSIERFPIVLIVIGMGMLVSLFGYKRLNRSQAESVPFQHWQQKKTVNWTQALPFVAITFCTLITYGFLQHTTGLRLQDQLDFTPAEAIKGSGGLLIASMVCMAVGQLILSFLSIKKARVLLLVGLSIGCGSLYALMAASSFTQLLLAMMAIGLGMSLIMPANLTLLSQSAGEHRQAFFASVNTVGKGLGWALGPTLGGALYQFSPLMPVWGAMVTMLIATSIAIYLGCGSRLVSNSAH